MPDIESVTPSVVVMGAPGLGKSTFAASVAEVHDPSEILLLVTKPGEEKSWGYNRYGLEAELFYDRGWRPSLGSFEAEGFVALMNRLYDLQEDEDYSVVILDPGTDAINLLEHYLMSAHGVGSPGDLPDTQGFYRQLKDTSQEFVQAAAVLSTAVAARPKVVIIPWHVQPAKEGAYTKVGPNQRQKVQSGDEKGAGIEYEGVVLPMLEGSYRRKLAGDVDLVLYCDIETKKNYKTNPPSTEVEYLVQVSPNPDRHSKLRIGPTTPGLEMVPNSYTSVMEALLSDS